MRVRCVRPRTGRVALGATEPAGDRLWRRAFVALLVLAVLSACLPGTSRAAAEPDRGARPAELVVVPRSVAQASSVAQGLEVRYSEVQTLAVGLSGKVLLVHVPPGREEEFRQRLSADPTVAAVARNYEVQADDAPLTPNDPSFPQQWGMTAVHAPEAWGAGARGTGVTVAVVDTGADYGHPDLAGALLPGCNFIVYPAVCSPTAAADDNGHGTHVAGTIAALTNNGVGVAGLAWGASILPLKALDSTGSGSWFSITDAMSYAASQPGVRVINLSLGSDPGFPPDASDRALLQGVIDNARSKGLVVIVAAGNSGVNLDTAPVYPAVLPGVVAVTALDQNGVKPAWANYGAAIAVAAPGVGILSTLCAYNSGTQSCAHTYGMKSGTSMAAPHVAALAALLIARTPGLTPDGVAALLKSTATDLGAPGSDPVYGGGRIDAATALTGHMLTLTTSGPGSVQGNPAATVLPLDAIVTLTAQPNTGAVFTGWTVDGVAQGWAALFTLKMDTNHAVTATFVPRPTFTDLSAGITGEAVAQLAARGIVHGYGDGTYGTTDTILRAQVAGLLTRALGWDGETHLASFTDQGAVDDELWRAVGTLDFHGVARGYGDGTYRPIDPLLHIQAISVISRAMVAKGYWVAATADDPTIYPNVPVASGHRLDLVTFVRNAGAVPDRPATGGASWADWDGPASRGWFARVLWQALDATLGVNPGP